MPLYALCSDAACLNHCLSSLVSNASGLSDSFTGQSSGWLLFAFHNPWNITLTLVALILITFTMIPKTYRKSSSPAHTPASSAPNSLAEEYKSENGQLEKERRRPWKLWWIVLAVATFLLALILGLSMGLTVGREHHGGNGNQSLSAIVDLGYSQYQGNTYRGVSQWLGIRYAAPPVGDLRFAAPQDPVVNSTLQKATQACWRS